MAFILRVIHKAVGGSAGMPKEATRGSVALIRHRSERAVKTPKRYQQEGQRPQVGDDSRPAAVEAPRLQGRPEGEWGANRPAVKVEETAARRKKQGATNSHAAQQHLQFVDDGAMDGSAGQRGLQGGGVNGGAVRAENNSPANMGKAARRRKVVKKMCAACACTGGGSEGPRGKSKAKSKGRGKGQSKAQSKGTGSGRAGGGSADDAGEDQGEMHVPAAPEASAQEDLVLMLAASGMGQTEDIGVPSGAFAALHRQAALEDVRGGCSGEQRSKGVVTRAAKQRAAEAEAAEVLCQLQTAQGGEQLEDVANAAGQDAAGDNAAGQLHSAAPSRKRKAQAAGRQQFAALAAVGDKQQGSSNGSHFVPEPDVQMLEVQQSQQDDFGDRSDTSAEQEAAEVIMGLCGDLMETQ
ncbi:hypothetical protein ABBQ32_004417 [Trebouxia sp. C0010 RCD-2024]